MSRGAARSGRRGHVELRDLLERIARVNPTGRGCPASEEKARYAEKATLQSLLIERYPAEVRAQAHEAMPGVVSLSVPRLRASAAHAIVEALSERARAWVEEQLRAAAAGGELAPPPGRAPAPLPQVREEPRLARAAELLAEYDFECAEAELASLAADAAAAPDARARALMMLVELHVDHLANDGAALALEPALRALGPLSEEAHELLGVAAARSGDAGAALHHLLRCDGERAAESLASLARACAAARAWDAATRAWERVQTLATRAEPPLAAKVTALRDDLRRHLAPLAERAEDGELSADQDLVRFVRELAPEHPWLRERRELARRSRTEASARALLDRAQAYARDGDLAGVEHALGLLARSAAKGAADAARIEELTAWTEERRAEAQAARALTLADAGDAEAACRAYAALPERARERVRAAGATPLFSVLEALRAAFPDRPCVRPLVRAAAAWVAAQGQVDPEERRLLVEPHAALLEAVPGLAAEVRRALSPVLAPGRPALTTGPQAPASAAPREVRIGGLCFLDVAEPAPGPIETIDVGPSAVRVGAIGHIVTLEALAERGAWQICLRPHGSHGRPRWIRIEGPASFQPGCILTTGHRIGIADRSGRIWMVTVVPELAVWLVDLAAFQTGSHRGQVVAVDENVLGVGAGDEGRAPSAWRLVDARTSALLGELTGPQIHRSRTAHGTVFHRISGSRVERLDLAGHVARQVELPRGLSPSAILDSPLSEPPVLLSEAAPHRAAMLWWQAEGGFFRAVELFDTIEHGAAIDAVALPGRGLCVVTQRRDGATFLHLVQATKSALRPAPRPSEAPGHLRLVVDGSGRRCWSVRGARGAQVEIRPLHLPDEHA